AVMYSSCSNTARIRSNAMAIAPCDLEEHILQRWFANVDVDDVHAGVADLEDSLRNAMFFGGDQHGVVRRQRDVVEIRSQSIDYSSVVTVETHADLRVRDAAGETSGRVMGNDAPL